MTLASSRTLPGHGWAVSAAIALGASAGVERPRRFAASRVNASASAGISLVSLAYRFLVGKPDVAAVVVGPASVEHLDAAHEGLAAKLPDDVAAAIETMHLAWTGTDARYGR